MSDPYIEAQKRIDRGEVVSTIDYSLPFSDLVSKYAEFSISSAKREISAGLELKRLIGVVDEKGRELEKLRRMVGECAPSKSI